jgi:uncharacterized membrane protein
MIQDQSESSFGLAPNVAAGLASFFMGLGGLVILLGKPPQQWVRFVAVQSIVLAVAWFVFWVALTMLNIVVGFIPGVRWILWTVLGIAYIVIAVAFFIAWIIQTVKAFQGQAQRFPVISEWTDRWVPVSTTL